MLRAMWVLVLLLVLGGLVASGFAHGWTQAHFGIGLPVAFLTVLALMPTRRRAPVAESTGRR